jgi:hypothetical protein
LQIKKLQAFSGVAQRRMARLSTWLRACDESHG